MKVITVTHSNSFYFLSLDAIFFSREIVSASHKSENTLFILPGRIAVLSQGVVFVWTYSAAPSYVV